MTVSLTCEYFLRLALMDPHPVLIALMEPAMWGVATLEATTAGLEVITPTQPLTVDAGKKFRCGIAVEVRESERVRRHVPSRSEPEKVCQRSDGVTTLCSEDDKD